MTHVLKGEAGLPIARCFSVVLRFRLDCAGGGVTSGSSELMVDEGEEQGG